MDNLPIEIYLIGGIAALLLIAFILIRFGKAIARVLLVLVGLAVVGILGLAMLQQSSATKETARAVEIASAGQAGASLGMFITSVGAIFMTILVIGIVAICLVIAGYFFLRWKLAEQLGSRQSNRLPALGIGSRRLAGQDPVVYVIEAPDEGEYDLLPIDWQRESIELWNESNWQS